MAAGSAPGPFLRPAPEAGDHAAEGSEPAPAGGHGGTATEDAEASGHADEPEDGAPEYVKMNNQFVVPVVEGGRVAAMVVLSLSLEVDAGNTEAVYQREPKLRDVFLQALLTTPIPAVSPGRSPTARTSSPCAPA